MQTVSVKDKDGKPIEGLTAERLHRHRGRRAADDQLRRIPAAAGGDGLLGAGGSGAAAGGRPGEPGPERGAADPGADPASRRRATSGTGTGGCWSSTSTRRRCRRRIRCAPTRDALKYIDTQMAPADLLAIMTFQSGAVRVQQDFTDNRAQLRELIQTLIFGDDQDGDGIPRSAARHGVRPGRRRVQHLQHRPPAVGAADGGDDAAAAARAEVADLLRQRPAAERHRQPGAAARHRQRRDPRQRRHPPDRRARPGGDAAARRCDAAVARRHRHVHRPVRQRRADATSSGRRTRSTRWPRTPAARRCSTTTICRSASCRRRRR